MGGMEIRSMMELQEQHDRINAPLTVGFKREDAYRAAITNNKLEDAVDTILAETVGSMGCGDDDQKQ